MKTHQAGRGRRALTRYSAEARERLIQEQVGSGLTKKAFCSQRGINLATFYHWRKPGRSLVRRPPVFAEVEVARCTPAAIEILLPNGARVGIRHPGGRDELVALVRGVAGC